MKLPIVIVRTVSVEKLSFALEACAARWSGHPILVVSNHSRASELRMDPRINEVISYATGIEGFVAPIACERSLEAVVVPVANHGGSGYANVMRACGKLKARSWFLAAYSRELRELDATDWQIRWRIELALGALARCLGCAWSWTIAWRTRDLFRNNHRGAPSGHGQGRVDS